MLTDEQERRVPRIERGRGVVHARVALRAGNRCWYHCGPFALARSGRGLARRGGEERPHDVLDVLEEALELAVAGDEHDEDDEAVELTEGALCAVARLGHERAVLGADGVGDPAHDPRRGGDGERHDVELCVLKRVARVVHHGEALARFANLAQQRLLCRVDGGLASHGRRRVENLQRRRIGLLQLGPQLPKREVALGRRRAARRVHDLRKALGGLVQRVAVVCVRRGLEHRRGLRKFCPVGEHTHVGLYVVCQFDALERLAANLLRRQRVRREDAAHQRVHAPLEQRLDRAHLAVVRLLRHRKARVRQQGASQLLKAHSDLLARKGKVVGRARREDFREVRGHLRVHLRVRHVLVELSPVANEELQALERRLGLVVHQIRRRRHGGLARRFGCGLDVARRRARSLLIRLDGHAAVLGEERELLQVVLLDAVGDVVNLVGRHERREPEDARRQAHGRLVVKEALRVQDDHGHVNAVWAGQDERLGPDRDARRHAVTAAAPLERGGAAVGGRAAVVDVALGDARALGGEPLVALGFLLLQRAEVAQDEREEERLARAEGPDDGDDADLEAFGALCRHLVEVLLVEHESVII
mmetsp:Transcript_31724/g.106883  ORF Transcript_31724/g.106883 Transcript_31724/m.106883 type:complete len:590 (-) Transcript_31724:120-1889(-)